jgi:hypothetical protein
MSEYEAPTITELGTVADFTRGDGFQGSHDSLSFTIWGREISLSYGAPPSS